jgi:hypothetical protein
MPSVVAIDTYSFMDSAQSSKLLSFLEKWRTKVDRSCSEKQDGVGKQEVNETEQTEMHQEGKKDHSHDKSVLTREPKGEFARLGCR